MEDYISPLSLPSSGNIHLGFGVGADALMTNDKVSCITEGRVQVVRSGQPSKSANIKFY